MKYEIEEIGLVEGKRLVVEDDFWGGDESCICLSERFGPEALDGIEEFSHVEVLFLLDRIDIAKVITGARHPRNNPSWPKVGIFAQRTKNRPNRIGSTICRIIRRNGIRLYVGELDALDGTPVIDIKPVFAEFLPREELTQPAWSHELMEHYWENTRAR